MPGKRLIALAEGPLTRAIIGAFFDVYNALGFGFLESVYAAALERELIWRGHRVEREVLIKIWYKGHVIARQRIDMLVDGKVVVEIKSGIVLPISGARQSSNYLRASDKEVGLLLHFGLEPKYYREYAPNQVPVQSTGSSGSFSHIRHPSADALLGETPVGDDGRRQ